MSLEKYRRKLYAVSSLSVNSRRKVLSLPDLQNEELSPESLNFKQSNSVRIIYQTNLLLGLSSELLRLPVNFSSQTTDMLQRCLSEIRAGNLC